GGVLVDEVVAALDRVEGVPLPRVLLDVRERRGHAALRRARVGTRGIELGDDSRLGVRAGLNGRAHACAARTDDDHVVLVVVDAVLELCVGVLIRHRNVVPFEFQRSEQNDASRAGSDPAGHGSKVNTTSVPSRIMSAATMPTTHTRTLRTLVFST